ncbi:MAG: hypothetical protein IH901_08370, partial [Proteobacteria bacterium]|nr:hypothetical protein [Pseudomonadota bacterium]
MKKSKLKSKLLAGCSISAIALMTSMPNVATAQQPEENEATAQQPRENLVVEEVLVTALKRETSIQDVPLA